LRRLLAKSETWLQGFRRLRDSADEGLKSSLLTEMARSGVPSVRHNALYEFARWKGRAAAPLLMQVLRKEDEEGSLRALAARELGEVGAIEATDLLLQAFRSGGDTLPLESANSLLKLGVPGPAREVLETCARNYESPDSAVRRKAVDSASQIEHASTLPLLSRALRDSSGDVRIEAITAISYGFPSEGRVLLEPLTRDPNAEVAEAAREALEHLRDDVK
jgi:HEAT repeat protein